MHFLVVSVPGVPHITVTRVDITGIIILNDPDHLHEKTSKHSSRIHQPNVRIDTHAHSQYKMLAAEKPVIIALYPIPNTIPNHDQLLEKYDVLKYQLSTPSDLKADMQKEPYRSAVAIFGSYPGFKPIGGLEEKSLIDALPPNLKVIGLCSAGYDGYDLQYLSSRNIKLCNVPVDKYVAMDVADCALWHVLSGMRKFNSWDRLTRTNRTTDNNSHTLKLRDEVRNDFVKSEEKQKEFAFGHVYHGQPVRRVSGRKCVIYGYGLIGKAVAERMLTIGMDVNVVVRDKSKYQDDNVHFYSSSSPGEVQKATLEANVLLVCLPGGKGTLKCINRQTFDNVSSDCVVVNIGRGSCIDTEALKAAVESGKVSHVGMDVFPNEPIIEPYWLDEKDVNSSSNKFFTTSVTPHLGSSTVDTLEFASFTCIENIMTGIEIGKFENSLNDQ